MNTDAIVKQIEINAPVSRVWRALTDHREFGEWFGARVDDPFVAGQVSKGAITYPGYEHIGLELRIERLDPETLFSFTWAHPKSLEKGEFHVDRANDPTTLVEFRLEKTATGTLLTVTESGFDKLPLDRRADTYRRNEGGWAQQMINIQNHVSRNP